MARFFAQSLRQRIAPASGLGTFMADQHTLKLYNTLTRRKEVFKPLDPENVRMYVCGPTVYDYAHIGNARPVIVFDVLFRLLRHIYGPGHVIYVRNITDVDDKINARSAEEGVPIRELTERTAKQFHNDIAALSVLPPTIEPRATEHIAEMKTLIEQLVAKGHAYVAENHVLFDVPSMSDYGHLSNRTLDEMEAGARVEVAPYKKDAMDFVLWKPSKEGDPSWPSPSGIEAPGRPGWHIECSAMAGKHLGDVFDIHGGGIDLVFPHHENEIAQSRCAHGTKHMARYWMHNGFLQVEGEKMSKSLGNFFTIHELLDTDKFGGRRWPGEVLRLAMLMTHYRQPMDFTLRCLEVAETILGQWYRKVGDVVADPASKWADEVNDALSDDLNTPGAITKLHAAADCIAEDDKIDAPARFKAAANALGLLTSTEAEWCVQAEERIGVDKDRVQELIASRLSARSAKNFKEADRIRDELAAMGIALKDSKDPKTGKIVTTWEVAR